MGGQWGVWLSPKKGTPTPVVQRTTEHPFSQWSAPALQNKAEFICNDCAFSFFLDDDDDDKLFLRMLNCCIVVIEGYCELYGEGTSTEN